MNIGRLQNLVHALREVQDPDTFTMFRIMHSCGTPACVLGQYAFRTDLQDEFNLRAPKPDDWQASGLVSSGRDVTYDGPEVRKHFDLNRFEVEDLFGAAGCNDADTPSKAADYIENFIKEKRLEALDEMVVQSEELGLYDYDQR